MPSIHQRVLIYQHKHVADDRYVHLCSPGQHGPHFFILFSHDEYHHILCCFLHLCHHPPGRSRGSGAL